MTPLVHAIVIIVPFAILIGVFFLGRFWLAKQPDRLAARHRGLGVLIWTITVLMLTAFILRRFVSPAPTGFGFMALMLMFAISQRRRLSRQLHER